MISLKEIWKGFDEVNPTSEYLNKNEQFFWTYLAIYTFG